MNTHRLRCVPFYPFVLSYYFVICDYATVFTLFYWYLRFYLIRLFLLPLKEKKTLKQSIIPLSVSVQKATLQKIKDETLNTEKQIPTKRCLIFRGKDRKAGERRQKD